MRLIDADAIPYCNYDLDNYHSFRAAEDDVIAEMPTIEAVPVVRCKDCKWQKRDIEVEGYWICNQRVVREDDFCSYGMRKEG